MHARKEPSCLYSVIIHQMAPPPTEVADIWLQLTTYISTSKGWKIELAWLVDLYRTVYPRKWSPVNCSLQVERRTGTKGKRPAFYVLNVPLCHAINQMALLDLLRVAFVTSRMDYCNSIMRGASAVYICGLFRMYSTQQHDSFFKRESMIASLLQFVTHCTGYRFSRG